jgi:hypothetical protein
MLTRRTVLAVLALALVIPASAPARQTARPKAPTGLKAFLLSYGELPSRNFQRTPSFAWKPLRRALSYEFELATARDFRQNSILWSTAALKVPATSVPIALPWVTGKPYGLFARVRARTQRGTTNWSSSFGFNVRWTQIPAQLPAPNGLLRWTPIVGATEYEVWAVNIGGDGTKLHLVRTNVTDMRDWFTFHQDPNWVGTAYWRVRTVRTTYGTNLNGHTTTSYGAWSPTFQTHATPPSTSQITLGSTVSNVTGTVAKPAAHALMPGFSWSGSRSSDGVSHELYRVYVFSDRDCVEPVLIGSIVGSPSWVPHLSGPLKLPGSLADIQKARGTILEDGDQGGTFDKAHIEIAPSETASASGSGDTPASSAPRTDLWDRAWPSGVYYWTVVPVEYSINSVTKSLEYQDVELPQDACAAGRIGTFGRVSQPIPTGSKASYVVGLSVTGRVMSSSASRSPRVYGSPLVTWSPALGADGFEIQWSHTRYPFTRAGSIVTAATSAALPLAPGSWYYRMRGINLHMPTASQYLAWSSVRKLRVARPVFRIS